MFDFLLLLLENRSRLLSDGVVRARLWGEVHVSDAALRRLIKEARRALGDDGARQEQIRTQRGRGVSFAPEVRIEDGWDTGFVGRGDLVESLERTLEGVAGGAGAVTLLVGPAGIGKTSALGEIAARAAARGFRVLRGSGRPGADGDAYHPWLDAAEQLHIADLLHGGDELRHERFRAVARALARGAEAKPLLVALDDLQFADGDSLALLRFVAPALRASRVWVLGAARSGLGETAPGVEGLRALAAESSHQVLPLRRLRADELRAVVSNQLGLELGAEQSERLWRRSDGNPFYALELARLARGERQPQGSDSAPEVTALLARRTAALADHTRSLLRAASAIGIEFEPALLREAEACSPAALTRALREATEAGLLDLSAGARRPRNRRFAHPLIAEAFYAELGRERARPAQHLRIAEALERLGRREPFVLARHYVASRGAAPAERIFPHALAAAREARGSCAEANAELWFDHALALAEEARVPVGELIDLLLARSELTLATTGLEARRVLSERGARLALAERDAMRLARAALVFADRPNFIEFQPRVIAWLEEARRLPSGDRSLESRVASRLGAELVASGSARRAEGEALVREGEAGARELGEPDTTARVLYDVCAATFAAAEPRAWAARAEEVARAAHASGDLELELRGHCCAAFGLLQLGERAGAEAALEVCLRHALEREAHYPWALAHSLEAMLAALDGRFAAARAALDRSAARASADGAQLYLLQLAGVRAWLDVEEGKLAALTPLLEATHARAPLPVFAAGLALVAALTGDRERAVARLTDLVERLDELPRNWSRLSTLALAAEVSFRVHAPMAAARIQRALEPFAPLCAVTHNAGLFLGSVSQSLGWLAAARGRPDAAVRHFEAALAVHTMLRSPPWIARSERAIAEVRSRRHARAS